MTFKTFFHQYYLKEAIENIEFKGHWDSGEGHGWDKSDIGILQSSVGLQKIKSSWKIKQPVDVYFFKNDTKGWKEYGRVSQQNLKWLLNNIRSRKIINKYDDFETDMDDDIYSNINPNHITIIYLSNVGDDKIPATSWILAHRFGHALGVVDRKFMANPFLEKIRKAIDDLFNNISNFVYQKDMSVDYSLWKRRELNTGETEEQFAHKMNQNNERLFNQHQLAMALGTFKSARDRRLSRTTEFINEIVAQYIITGRIVFNRNFMNVLDPEKTIGTQKQLSSDEQQHVNSYLTNMEKYLNGSMEKMLNAAIGEVFIM